MAFDHVEFPLELAHLESAPEFHTTITQMGNGYEYRNADWENARKWFDAGLGIKTLTQARTLDKFHRARKGRARGFLLKDLADFKCGGSGSPEPFATIVSGTATYQITKAYSDAATVPSYGATGNTDNRPITKPKPGTWSLYAGVTLLTLTTHYSIDYKTGIITLTTTAQTNFNGQVLGGIGEFYTPVRFDIDRSPIRLFEYVLASDEGATDFPSVPIVEIRDIS
jgi:uncharacterized protein (TIGR02217 family)